jgi:hypothetical protein
MLHFLDVALPRRFVLGVLVLRYRVLGALRTLGAGLNDLDSCRPLCGLSRVMARWFKGILTRGSVRGTF